MSAECGSGNIPPGYKQTEVGVIPEDLKVDSLIHFWNVMDCKHVTAHFIANGFPVASIKEVQSRFVDLNNAKQTTQQFYNLLIEGGRKPQVGDLIMSRNATVGEVAQVAEWHPPFAMGQDVCLLRKKSLEFSTKYLQAVFRSPIIGNQLSNLMVGSTFKRVNVQQIKNFIIPMPAPAEQEAIAEALYDTDTLIESLEQLVTKKRQIKQGAMQELLTGSKRLPGFEIKAGYKNTEIGLIPEDWLDYSVGELIDFEGGSQPDKRVFSPTSKPGYVKLIQIRDYKTDKYETYVPTNLARRFCTESDIMIGRYGPPIFQILRGLSGAYNVALIKAKPRPQINLTYAYYFLKQYKLFEFIDKLSQRSSGQTGIDLKELRSYPLSLPPTKAEQEAIATILSDMDSEITLLEEKLTKARQLKQGMMQELLTGRIRLL